MIECCPSLTVVLSQEIMYGAEVTGLPTGAPSTKNDTFAICWPLAAVAYKETVALKMEPVAGLVIWIDGPEPPPSATVTKSTGDVPITPIESVV